MAGYEDLLTYTQCEEIYDLTVEFCQRFLPGRELLRQREQMIQAARSAKQCIAEGASQKTSLEGYIKMLGISRGSLEELLKDYQDFARLRNISIWEKSDSRLKEMGERVKKAKREKGETVNYLIDLIIRTNYLLDRQKTSLEEKFVREGGYSEKLFKRRLVQRKQQE